MRSGNVRFHSALDSILVDISILKPHPENANNGDVDAIVESILENGFYPQPLVVDSRNYEIVIGNHRYFALMELGSELAPVFFVDSDDEIEILKIMLVDNRTNDLRRYDMGQLAKVLEKIQSERHTLKGTGFADDYLEKLREGDRRAQEAIEQASTKKEPVSLDGDRGIMFLEISFADQERFRQLAEGSTDSERFVYLLDLAEELS